MSKFNWDAFGPVGGDPEAEGDDRAAAQGTPGREASTPTQHDWDFLLGDDSGLTTEAMTAQLEEFLDAAKDAQTAAAAVTADAWDRDHLVHVTVNSVGVVTSTEFDADAMRRSSPRNLAAAVTEAAQAAAAAAQTAVANQLSPLLPGLDQLEDAVPVPPGAPDVNQFFDDLQSTQRRLYHEPGDPGLEPDPDPRPNTDGRTRT